LPSDIESNNDSIDVINSNTTEVISSGEKQYKRPSAQPMISNYLVNVDAGQHPLATSSNAKVSVACADVHARAHFHQVLVPLKVLLRTTQLLLLIRMLLFLNQGNLPFK
jgi:hypothetical protein